MTLALAAVLFAAVPPARSQHADPVKALEQVLSERPVLPREGKEREKAIEKEKPAREKKLNEALANLRTLGQQGQALLSLKWPGETVGGDPELVAVDREARRKLLAQFKSGALGLLTAKGPAVRRVAAATLLGEVGAEVNASRTPRSLQNLDLVETFPEFAEALEQRLQDEDEGPAVRAAAARALGRLRPMSDDRGMGKPQAEPERLLKVVGAVLAERKTPVEVRRAAAEALVLLLRPAQQTEYASGGQKTVELSPRQAVVVARGIGAAAGTGLADSDDEVRRLSATAFHQVVMSLNEELRYAGVSTPEIGAEEDRVALERRLEILEAQAERIRAIGAALVKVVNDPSPPVRLTARRILEDMGDIRQRWIARADEIKRIKEQLKKLDKPAGNAEGQGASQEESEQAAPEDELRRALAATLTALLQGLDDPRPIDRLAAAEALEMIVVRGSRRSLGEEWGADNLSRVGRHLSRSLGDANRFVRWTAARTLGRMEPRSQPEEVKRGAVAGLARLLADPDVDVRQAAAVALEQYGPDAEAAVPALARAARQGDTEVRIAAIRALAAVQKRPDVAVPALTVGVFDPNLRTRRAAVAALIFFGRDAATATTALERALFDGDAEVRRLASDALLEIQRPR